MKVSKVYLRLRWQQQPHCLSIKLTVDAWAIWVRMLASAFQHITKSQRSQLGPFQNNWAALGALRLNTLHMVKRSWVKIPLGAVFPLYLLSALCSWTGSIRRYYTADSPLNWMQLALAIVHGSGLRCTACAKSLTFSTRWVWSQYFPQTKQLWEKSVWDNILAEIQTRGRWVRSENAIHCAMRPPPSPHSKLELLRMGKNGHPLEQRGPETATLRDPHHVV